MLLHDYSFLSDFKNVLIYEKFSDFCAIILSTKLKKNFKKVFKRFLTLSVLGDTIHLVVMMLA